jgi:hypothetical protein
VLGAPEARPLTLDELVDFGRGLPAELWPMIAFLRYGEVDAEPPALADRLRQTIVVHAGLPTIDPKSGQPETRVVRPDGGLGSRPPSATLSYRPRDTAVPPRPRLESAPEAASPRVVSPPSAARLQPEPAAAASAVVQPGQDLVAERRWLRTALGPRYDDGAGFVTRLLSQTPGLRPQTKAETRDAVSELVAAHVYLTSGTARSVDDAVRTATDGAHVPLARCVVAGLRRMPSYRGVSLLRASLTDAELDVYRRTGKVTEWACCSALTSIRPNPTYDTDVLVWSLTARRTALLDPAVADRVVFLPGTVLRVLRVSTGDGRRTVLLRELVPDQVDAVLDSVALGALEGAAAAMRERCDAEPLPAKYARDFAAPPGLLAPAEPALGKEPHREPAGS